MVQEDQAVKQTHMLPDKWNVITGDDVALRTEQVAHISAVQPRP